MWFAQNGYDSMSLCKHNNACLENSRQLFMPLRTHDFYDFLASFASSSVRESPMHAVTHDFISFICFFLFVYYCTFFTFYKRTVYMGLVKSLLSLKSHTNTFTPFVKVTLRRTIIISSADLFKFMFCHRFQLYVSV